MTRFKIQTIVAKPFDLDLTVDIAPQLSVHDGLHPPQIRFRPTY